MIGRHAEIALLRGMIADGGTAVLLRGEAGIGKSALLAEAARTAGDDLLVLRVTGVESEAELPFAALHLLLRPARQLVDGLPVAQREALRGAFGESRGGAPDRFLVGLAVLTLLADLAAERPLLCLIDDVQWLDGASVDALVFAARRLGAERITMIMAARDDGEEPPVHGVPEVRLAGLDRADCEKVLAEAVADLVPEVRDRVIEEAEGNPLALLEFAGALTPEQRAGRLDPLPLQPPRLPLAGRLERSLRVAVRQLPEPAQLLLLIAAAEGSGSLELVLRVAGDFGAGLGDLEPGVGRHLVQVSGGRLRFRHPLVKTAAYHEAPFALRVAVHRALAHALDGDRRAWQLSAACVGPDEETSAALAAAGERARRRGSHASAATAYERAAQLTVDAQGRARHLASAAEAALGAGQLPRAGAAADRGRRLTGDPTVLARLAAVRATVDSEHEGPATPAYSDDDPPAHHSSNSAPPTHAHSNSPPALAYSDNDPPAHHSSGSGPPTHAYSDSPPALAYSGSPPALAYSDDDLAPHAFSGHRSPAPHTYSGHRSPAPPAHTLIEAASGIALIAPADAASLLATAAAEAWFAGDRGALGQAAKLLESLGPGIGARLTPVVAAVRGMERVAAGEPAAGLPLLRAAITPGGEAAAAGLGAVTTGGEVITPDGEAITPGLGAVTPDGGAASDQVVGTVTADGGAASDQVVGTVTAGGGAVGDQVVGTYSVFSALMTGADDAACELAAARVAACREQGLIGALPHALQLLTQAQILGGRHAEAAASGAEAWRIAHDTGQAGRLRHLHGILARLAAIQGEDEACLRLARQAEGTARERNGSGWGGCALALLDLVRARYDAVAERMTRMLEGPLGHTVIVTFAIADHVEACARLNDPDRAAQAFARFDDWAAASGRPWAAAVAHRCRALLAPREEAEAHYNAALERHAQGGREFEQARTQLSYGEWLRRARRRSDAAAQLRSAMDRFATLRATPWAERARTELLATGTGVDLPELGAKPHSPDTLTPQELQVVRLAATGATNRQIGAQLFLSPRTVGFHLYKAYPKLGVSSRTDLSEIDFGPAV